VIFWVGTDSGAPGKVSVIMAQALREDKTAYSQEPRLPF